MSLHLRIFLSASLVLSFFLGAAGWAINQIYIQTAEQHLQQQLKNQIFALLAAAKETEQGTMLMPVNLPDPQLNNPGSSTRAMISGEQGRYQWHSLSYVEVHQTAAAEANPIACPAPETGQYRYQSNQQRSCMSFSISWEDYETNEHIYHLYIDTSRQSINQQTAQFKRHLWLWLGGSGLFLVLIQAIVLHWGLYPVRRASQEIIQVQNGEINQLSTQYPVELSILTNNINQLVQYSNQQLQRYRNSLGDLSHSLKTPITIIQGELDNKQPKQQFEQLKQHISEQLQQINERVHYHLQRASIAGNSPLINRVLIKPTIEEICRALQKVYLEKQIQLQLDLDPEMIFYGDKGDLMELLGNLLDNAFKYCDQQVRVKLSAVLADAGKHSKSIHLEIENDGAGVAPEQLSNIVQRGMRADEQQSGHGIGLHIVHEIIQQYQAQIAFSNTAAGFKVSLSL